ncbi:uncharacterized protein LOC101862263 [Aplysia californica]|uniref:Uncharacterized protein LOC101862263 n=1 Tax=Aplysia californica TaxID=6500 RepID=A0ABM0JKW4_APLCA|nr:uncharacterized protein LOC101862263 [Aplysia californica]
MFVLELLLLLIGFLAAGSAEENCGWPKQIILTKRGIQYPSLDFTSSQTNSTTDVLCQTVVASDNGVSVHVWNYNITRGLSFKLTGILFEYDTIDIAWQYGQFADYLTVWRAAFLVTYSRPAGTTSANEHGFRLGLWYVMQSQSPCSEGRWSTFTASPRTRLLYPPGYLGKNFMFREPVSCKWKIAAPPGFVLDVKLVTISPDADIEINGKNGRYVPRIAGSKNVTITSQQKAKGFVVEYTAVPMETRSCSVNNTDVLTGLGDWYVLDWSIRPSGNEDVLECGITFDSGSDSRVVEVTVTDYRPLTSGQSCADQTVTVIDESSGVVLLEGVRPEGPANCTERTFPFSTIRASGRKLSVFLFDKKHSDVRETGLTLVVKSRDINSQVLDPAAPISYAWVPAGQISENDTLMMTLTQAVTANCSVLEAMDKNLSSQLVLSQKMSVFNGPSEEYFELTKDCNGKVLNNTALFPLESVSLVVHGQSEGFWIKYQANRDVPCERVYTPVTGASYTLSETVQQRKHLDCYWHLINDNGLIGVKTNFSSYDIDSEVQSFFFWMASHVSFDAPATVPGRLSVLAGDGDHNSHQPLLTNSYFLIDPDLWLYAASNLTVRLEVDTPNHLTNLEFQYKTLPSENWVQKSCSMLIINATSEIQQVETFNYPDYMMSDLDCQWNITRADPSHLVTLEVSSLRYIALCEGNDRPVQLTVYLYSEGDTSGTELDICGIRGFWGFAQAFAQETVVLRLKVAQPVIRGLYFRYSSIDPQDTEYRACNETIHLGDTTVSRNVTFYPHHFPGPTVCYWRFLSGSESQAVILTNVNFNFIPPNWQNQYPPGKVDFISVVNGKPKTILSTETMTSDSDVVSIENEMLLQVDLTEYLARKMTLTFTANTVPITGCNGTTLTLTVPANGAYQDLTSPNYPDHYPPNSRCAYILRSEDDTKVIEMSVHDLDIPKLSPNLTCTYYMIHDRVVIVYDEYSRFTLCNDGQDHKKPIFSSRPEVKVEFFSYEAQQGHGFLIKYRAVDRHHSPPSSKSPDDDSLVAIVCGSVAGFMGLVIIVAVLIRLRRARSHTQTTKVSVMGQAKKM